jgi:DNA primase small subunit
VSQLVSKEITLQKLKLMFHEYYSGRPNTVDTPHRIQMREFALETWERNWICFRRESRDESGRTKVEGCGASGTTFSNLEECPRCGSKDIQVTGWNRHLSYGSSDELLKALITKAPHSVYHSAAFYAIPVAKQMGAKEWQGAELVFDIDADHLELPCANEHDVWRCANPECGKTGTGTPPDKCPVCERASFDTRKWLCEKCLSEAKKHTIKLYDEFLVGDFGIPPEDIQLNYSGHRGYHVRVRDSRVFPLDDSARMEIVNYIMGLGLLPDRTIVSRSGLSTIPGPDMPGWYGKLAPAIAAYVRSIPQQESEGEDRLTKVLRNQREAVLEGLRRERPILSRKVKGIGPKSWQEIVVRAVEVYGGEIDKPVTHDIHRVIRLIGSLSGKTGFLVSEVPRDELERFNPFRDAIAFTDGTLRVVFPPGPKVPAFRIGDTKYGPFSDESVELPAAAAAFALCKGVATLE